jgi:hypothetical protein
MTAAVEGVARAADIFTVDMSGVSVGFDTDERRRVKTIWAECKTENFRAYAPSILAGDGTANRPHEVKVPMPPEIAELESVLQYIESLGSFWLGISRIGWGEAEIRWIPDSDEERESLKVSAITNKLEYPTPDVPFRAERLGRLLALRRELNYLVIPMSFYREGRRDFAQHRYVSAFFGFYFFLEDLYGSGKTKNAQVLEAFRTSTQLTRAVAYAHEQFETPAMAQNRHELRKLVTALRCEYSPSGLIEFLVEARGALHHFSQRSTRPKGHPLNQFEWRTVALLGVTVCVALIQLLANGARLETN